MAHSRHSRIDNCDYTVGDEGEIIVKSRYTNEEGVFDQYGAHIRGELKQADVQMCQFLAKLGKFRP